jgi:deazaflavin-dependent oxidoreductase (nitroreductase family)
MTAKPGLERQQNPFLRSGRALSALQLPMFALRPPTGFGVLTTTGRKTGKTRRKCVRVIRSGNKAYLVSIGGASSAWVKNIEANPNVRLRIRGGTFSGVARQPREEVEAQQAMQEYCGTVNPFDYVECANWRKGRPTRSKIKELHRTWFDHGMPLVIELAER